MCQISQFDELSSWNIGYSFQNQIVSPIGYILDKYNSFAAEMAGCSEVTGSEYFKQYEAFI